MVIMKIRKFFLPRPIDITTTLFFILIVPIIFWYELTKVIPYFHTMWEFWYTFHFICASIIMFHLSSSMVAVILCDTSIKGVFVPSDDKNSGTGLCAVCEGISPPRSYHCETCRTCILRRDHHCIFTSCCIGHNNYRYFVTMLFYLSLGTMYALYFNVRFIYLAVDFTSIWKVITFIFPMLALVVNRSEDTLHIILFIINALGCIFALVLLWMHGSLIITNKTTFEKNHQINKYDLGWKRNIKEVFGERWYISWISPFIKSELPHDGVIWDSKQS